MTKGASPDSVNDIKANTTDDEITQLPEPMDRNPIKEMESKESGDGKSRRKNEGAMNNSPWKDRADHSGPKMPDSIATD